MNVQVIGSIESNVKAVIQLLEEYKPKNLAAVQFDHKSPNVVLFVQAQGRVHAVDSDAYDKAAQHKKPILMIITGGDTAADRQAWWKENKTSLAKYFPKVAEFVGVATGDPSTTHLNIRPLIVEARRESAADVWRKIELLLAIQGIEPVS